MAKNTNIQNTRKLEDYDTTIKGYTAKDLVKDTSTVKAETTTIKVSNLQAPSYYKTAIAPIDYIMANNLNFCEGNIIKYITRYKEKGGVEDLKKAKNYIEYLIEHYSENSFESYNRGF